MENAAAAGNERTGVAMKRMTAGRLALGAFSLVAALAASSSGAEVAATRQAHLASAKTAAASAAHLMVFGGHSAAQLAGSGATFDAALADLARHAAQARAGHELQDLRAMNPAAHFAQPGSEPLVAIDAVTRGDPQRLKSALVALGLERPVVYLNDVGGWLPVAQLGAAAARAEVHALRAAMFRRNAVIATQGDFAQGSSALRSTYPTLSGAGVTVGVISDSFNCYGVYDRPGSGVPASGNAGYAPNGFADDDATFDAAHGYLSASVNVLEEADQNVSGEQVCLDYGQPFQTPFADEGRAMLQIVHAVAPESALAFYTASNSEADFASGIGALAKAGAKVIADDTTYFDEPFFQDGLVAQAIDTVEAQGVAYFTAAGNNGSLSYENTAPGFATISSSGPTAGEHLLNWDTSGHTNTTSLPVTIAALAPGEFVGLIVQWDQPYVTGAPGSPGASSEINLCVSGASGYTLFTLDSGPLNPAATICTGANATGADPVQVLILGNRATASGNTAATDIDIIIGLAAGTAAPGRIKLVVGDDGAGSTINSFATNSPTIQGHGNAAGAVTLAAAFFPQTPACGTSPAQVEIFSAEGGDPILFNTSGTRLATPLVRQKPDLTAPDGVNTSFFGFFLADSGFSDNSSIPACKNDATYQNFFGTSAATPHAAGAAALMLQANPALTPTQIYQSLRSTALAMGTSTPNFESGYGFIDVGAAVAALPAAPPLLKLASSTIAVGGSTTLTWLAVNSTACTASGSWSGAQSNSGTLTVNPAAIGSYTYTLACTGSAGTQTSSALLTVKAVQPLILSTSSLPAGMVGSSYSATLAASGGITPYTWSLASGTLPAGVSLNATSGTLSGTPTVAAAATALTFKVTDAEQPAQSKTASLSLTIKAAASSGGGGGGALGADSLVLLGGLLLARSLRRRPAAAG
jgi:Subtilase family/Putative Ig domain